MAHKRPTFSLLLDSTTWTPHITPSFIGLYRPWRRSVHTPMMPIFLRTHAISWWLGLLLRETHSPMALVVWHSGLPSSNATTACDSILTETNLLLNELIQNMPARHPGLMRPDPWHERVHMHANMTHTMHARHTPQRGLLANIKCNRSKTHSSNREARIKLSGYLGFICKSGLWCSIKDTTCSPDSSSSYSVSLLVWFRVCRSIS
jgi:hypothetical protein